MKNDMATITEDYVSLEVAKLLKAKGFDEPVATCYSNYNGLKPYTLINTGVHSYKNSTEHSPFWISAPTLQMAMKWLREVHNIHIDTCSIWDVIHWIYQVFIITPRTAHNSYVDKILYTSYEQAIEAAIKYCLENLI